VTKLMRKRQAAFSRAHPGAIENDHVAKAR
jgi:hypothetical protein